MDPNGKGVCFYYRVSVETNNRLQVTAGGRRGLWFSHASSRPPPPLKRSVRRGNMDEETLKQISRMCEIILGNRFGNRELDGLALYVGHHPLILNPGYKEDAEQCFAADSKRRGTKFFI